MRRASPWRDLPPGQEHEEHPPTVRPQGVRRGLGTPLQRVEHGVRRPIRAGRCYHLSRSTGMWPRKRGLEACAIGRSLGGLTIGIHAAVDAPEAEIRRAAPWCEGLHESVGAPRCKAAGLYAHPLHIAGGAIHMIALDRAFVECFKRLSRAARRGGIFLPYSFVSAVRSFRAAREGSEPVAGRVAVAGAQAVCPSSICAAPFRSA